MTDIFDRASEHEQELRDDALAAQRRRAGLTGKTWRDSAEECRVCGAGIPLKRRKAVPGVQTCVECQADLERAVHPAPDRYEIPEFLRRQYAGPRGRRRR